MSYNNPCPNCGARHFSEKEPCKKCGYKVVESKELPEITLMYCRDCGCTYSDGCSTHGADQQEKVKLSTPKEKKPEESSDD
jgi:NMD protein affecting ribosome stability and mRNA decay